jgi:hypothetical protein
MLIVVSLSSPLNERPREVGFDGRGGSCRRDPLLWGRGEECDG